MKTLHLYLVRQFLLTLIMTVAVFSFVMLLVNVLREILLLLVSGQATLMTVIQSVLLLFPYVLAWSLPMGMLTATLLVCGRFSADQELTAARASGISLLSLVSPLLLLALAFSLLCAWINLEVAPACRVAQKQLIHHQGLARLDKITQHLPAGTHIDEIPGKLINIGRVNEAGQMENVLIYELRPDGSLDARVQAAQAEFLNRNGTNLLVLYRMTRTIYENGRPFLQGTSGKTEYPLPLQQGAGPKLRIKPDDKTFRQLHAEMLEIRRTLQLPFQGTREELQKYARQLRKEAQDLTLPIRVHMHHQVAYSFACIGFALIGIPLGIQAHRRETSIGVAIALVLVLVYYGFVILAQSLSKNPSAAPHLLVWAPNFLFQLTGGALLWRLHRRVG